MVVWETLSQLKSMRKEFYVVENLKTNFISSPQSPNVATYMKENIPIGACGKFFWTLSRGLYTQGA